MLFVYRITGQSDFSFLRPPQYFNPRMSSPAQGDVGIKVMVVDLNTE